MSTVSHQAVVDFAIANEKLPPSPGNISKAIKMVMSAEVKADLHHEGGVIGHVFDLARGLQQSSGSEN